MNNKMEEEKKEESAAPEESSPSAGSAAPKFGLTAAGTVVMDGENDFCLQYFRAMECWKRPTQEWHSNVSLAYHKDHETGEFKVAP